MNDAGSCGKWGLFGMLAESAIPSDAYTTLEELPERPGWWEVSTCLMYIFAVLFF